MNLNEVLEVHVGSLSPIKTEICEFFLHLQRCGFG